MKKRLIIANWKMYPTLADSLVLAGSIKKGLDEITNVDIVIAPPTAWLLSVVESARAWPSSFAFCAQNIWPEDQGAYTGEISAYLLKNIVKYAIIGHSERRENQKEDNDLINSKVQAALKWGITPVLCIGEKKEIDIKGTTADVNHLVTQLIDGLQGVRIDNLHKVVVAYEPIWAIGHEKSASPNYAAHIITALRNKIAKRFYRDSATDMRFLYGGSVNSEDAPGFFAKPEIDGLLVGHKSVNSREFIKICKSASSR